MDIQAKGSELLIKAGDFSRNGVIDIWSINAQGPVKLIYVAQATVYCDTLCPPKLSMVMTSNISLRVHDEGCVKGCV
jgi:hypothetical protein